MNLLQFIADEIAALDGGAHPILKLVAAKIDAFNASPHATDGAKVQAVVDGLVPVVGQYLPVLAPYLAVVAVFEPYLGKAVDAVEDAVTPIAPDSGVAEQLPADAPVE